MDEAKLEKLGLKAGNVNVDNPDIRYSVSDEDINPDTGYRRGSIEDSFMRIVNAGDEQRALDMLQSMLERMAAFEATRAERSNPADAFMPKPELTDDLVAKNRAAIQSLIDKYGRMEQTKAAARRVNFPNQIDDDTKVRGVIRTAASAKATPEALVSEFERSILDGDAGYTYEYKLTDGQRETYRGLFVERLSSELSYLMSDDWYLDASVEERLEMLDETWSDTLDEVKRDMADWLWDHGIESTKKE